MIEPCLRLLQRYDPNPDPTPNPSPNPNPNPNPSAVTLPLPLPLTPTLTLTRPSSGANRAVQVAALNLLINLADTNQAAQRALQPQP